MKKWIATAAMAMICFAAHAQKEQVLFTVADDTVTKKEFEYIYQKNNAQVENAWSEEKVREYLNLYINFKLKVKAAKEQGIDTTQEFVKEFEGYKEQLIKPYLTDRTVTDELVKEAYERSLQEVEARHILISVEPDAPPADTLAAYNKIVMVRDSIMKGADFGEMAEKFSTDPSAKENKGDLGYFTALQMIYPFENAVYGGEIGTVSKPIRTQFGYHIIEVMDKRPTRGERQVAHLMIRPGQGLTDSKDAGAKEKVDSLYQQLKKGANFEQLVRDFSEDPSTKAQGGKLPKFAAYSRFLPPDFIDSAFAIEKVGGYSHPFQTRYGWHIIKLLDTFPVQTEAEMEEQLRTKIARDSRSELSQEAAINQIKDENKFKAKRKRLKPVEEQLDSTLLAGKFDMGDKELASNKWVMKIGKERFYPADFIDWLEENQKPNRYKYLPYAIDQYYRDWVDETVVNYQINHLEETHPEYKNLLKEYKEGILLFDITDKMVWSKAMTDTTGLEAYFQQHQTDYTWDQRVDAEVYSAKNGDVAEAVQRELGKGISGDSLVKMLNKIDPINLGYTKGKFEESDNEVVDQVQWQKGIYKVQENDKDYVVRIKEVIPPQPKQLSDIRGMVIADYQDFLEKQWIEELKQKYPVTVNEKVLDKLFK